MENRERDRMNKRESPTDGGRVNRETSERMSREGRNSDKEFGQSIGKSERPLENDESDSSSGRH